MVLKNKTKRSSRFKSMRDKVRKKAEQSVHKGSFAVNLPKGFRFFSPKKGTYYIDILPYIVSDKNHPDEIPVGETWYRREILVHKKIGTKEKNYICPRTIGKPCPICEYRTELMKDPDHDDKEIQALKPQVKHLYNILDKTDDPKNEEIQIFEFSYYNFGRVLDEELKEEDEEFSAFADLQGGYTLRVRFTENVKNPKFKYLEASKIDFKPRRKDYPESILEKTADLDKIFTVLPYKDLEKIFTETDTDSEDEEEETPFKSSKKRKPDVEDEEKDSENIEEEDSEDIEEDEDNEDLEEEDSEDIEEDEDDEDLEEEEFYSKRSKRNGKVKRNECPAGGTFGKDFDKYEDCEDCDLFDACNQSYKNKYKKRKVRR